MRSMQNTSVSGVQSPCTQGGHRRGLQEEGGLWMKYCMPGILLLAEAQGVGVGESDKENQFFTHPFVVWGVRVDSQLTILIWQLHSAFNV